MWWPVRDQADARAKQLESKSYACSLHLEERQQPGAPACEAPVQLVSRWLRAAAAAGHADAYLDSAAIFIDGIWNVDGGAFRGAATAWHGVAQAERQKEMAIWQVVRFSQRCHL